MDMDDTLAFNNETLAYAADVLLILKNMKQN